MKRPLTIALATLLLVVILPGCASTADLGGTSWRTVEVLTMEGMGVEAMHVDFGTDGYVTTNWTTTEGVDKTARSRYGVYENSLLIVRETEDGDLHMLKRVDGGELFLTSEAFHARLVRAN